MIRVLLASALPVIGLGIAAASLGPDLLAMPRGEPIVMVSPEQATLQAATFDGSACPSKLLFAGSREGGNALGLEGTHIVAFALRSGEKDVAVGIEDFPSGKGKPSTTVVLVFDAEGHLIAAGDPASLHLPVGDKFARDCAADPVPVAPI